jgi:hypothetical protein
MTNYLTSRNGHNRKVLYPGEIPLMVVSPDDALTAITQSPPTSSPSPPGTREKRQREDELDEDPRAHLPKQ